jgi:porphobilinogen synthase
MNYVDSFYRARRNRLHPQTRALLQETVLTPQDFVQPLFVKEGKGEEAIASLPNVYRHGIDSLLKQVHKALEAQIPAILLFACTPEEKKDPFASYAKEEDSLLYRAVSEVKKRFPEIVVWADVALDPFTDHGHDGIVNESGEVLNDETVEILCEMAGLLADAGVDSVAPSDMMDGRVAAIRSFLDKRGDYRTGIVSYAAKYASSFYGPFRDALGSGLKKGDKKGYQLNPANSREALLEAALDEEEGADLLIVKPALCYLDVLYRISEKARIPVGVYHVSGEYAMAYAAHEKGWLDAKQVLYESCLSLKRAGARFIISYAAQMLADTYGVSSNR